jgi:hypothetical protein
VKIAGLGKPGGCKLIRISADLQGPTLRSIQIRGDFFASPEEVFDQVEKALEGIRLCDLSGAFDAFIRERGVETYGISGAGLAEVVEAAAHAAGGESPGEARRGR